MEWIDAKGKQMDLHAFWALQMCYMKSVMLVLESSFGCHALVTKDLAVCTTDTYRGAYKHMAKWAMQNREWKEPFLLASYSIIPASPCEGRMPLSTKYDR